MSNYSEKCSKGKQRAARGGEVVNRSGRDNRNVNINPNANTNMNADSKYRSGNDN